MQIFRFQILFCGFLLALNVCANLPAQKLSSEGKQRKAIHDFLFKEFSKDRESVYRGKGTDRGLKELVILKKEQTIRDGEELVLPLGSERIAVLFRHFGIHGSGLDRIKEVRVYPFSPDQAPPRSVQNETFYRVQMPSLPLSDKPFDQMKIKFLMKANSEPIQIKDLVFYAQRQIPPKFDTIAYQDLGSEFPRDRVPVKLRTDYELVVGGTSDLQRERWFRTHDTPGSNHPSFEQYAFERGFLPGRGAFKFNPALTKGWGKNPPQLKEDPNQPGSADLSFFARYDAGGRLRQAIKPFQEAPFALCFNDWPEFMSVPFVGRGTPLQNRFDEAAELAAAFVADQIQDAGYTAAWWEVKNESTVQSEWAHHWKEKQGIDGWGLLADFHNRVADAVHEVAPDVKVGGPTSAYMQVQARDFQLFRNQARFITETRGHIDFFSHHFYENALTLGAHARRGLGYSNYLLGRYEAILDMLRAHMHKADNVLPILITETGSLQNGRQPSDNWLRLCAWSAMLNKSMQRPDQIEMYVPFIFLNMSWNPISGDSAFTPKTDRQTHRTIDDFEPTTVANYFELWRDFDGKRLPVDFERAWLDVVAVHDGNSISLAITNTGGRQVAIDLSADAKRLGAEKIVQKRLNYHQGDVVFEPEHDVDAAAIPIDVNETTVVRMVLAKPLTPAKKIAMTRWYAHQTAVKSDGKPIAFEINVDDPQTVRQARLVVGAHRRGGINKPLVAELNGKTIKFDTGDASEFTEYFAPLSAEVSHSDLGAKNQIKVTAQAGTTITSVQMVTHALDAKSEGSGIRE